MSSLLVNNLALTPLGAGDLIDRAVRLYRRHFATLLRIAAPPVLITAAGWVLMSVSWRSSQATDSTVSLAIYVLLIFAGFVLWIGGMLFNVIVMGGAARTLVAHLLSGAPVTARATYANVRARFWGLLAASLIIGTVALILSVVIFYAWIIVLSFSVLGIIFLSLPTWLLSLAIIALSVLTLFAALWLLFWLMGYFAYVPQVMLVEGKGVFEAIMRSASLARGNTRRLMAMIFFTIVAAYSALMILVVPLGWYGYLNGVDPFTLSAEQWPAWYAISYEVLGQLSSILLAPVWMLGLSLMYVDERVRHEGYDIEMLAARRLGEIPRLAGGRLAPITPALVKIEEDARPPAPPSNRPPAGSTLGLR